MQFDFAMPCLGCDTAVGFTSDAWAKLEQPAFALCPECQNLNQKACEVLFRLRTQLALIYADLDYIHKNLDAINSFQELVAEKVLH